MFTRGRPAADGPSARFAPDWRIAATERRQGRPVWPGGAVLRLTVRVQRLRGARRPLFASADPAPFAIFRPANDL